MRQPFSVFLIISLMLMACQSGTGPKPVSTDRLPAARPANPDPMDGQEEALQKQADELARQEPGHPGQLKGMLPATLMGATKLSEEERENNGVPMALAAYKINDTIRIELCVYDCAGPAGAGFYTTHFAALASARGEAEGEYIRGVELGPHRGFEQGDKTGASTTITWMVNRRYLVTLNGTRVGPAALRQAASSIRL